jgi:nucleoside-diphosphate-sugar epimerase
MGFYRGMKVLVTGGASFIGSHLVAALLRNGAVVTVADDFTSGHKENLAQVRGDIRLLDGDLRRESRAAAACRGQELIFHLAAAHGGRVYIDTHQVDCGQNLALDQQVFDAALRARAGKIVFASSGCVYPLNRQRDPAATHLLSEDSVGPPYWPDGMYGLAKLAGELYLRALHAELGIPSACCRYFTAYGPRAKENHAIMAMIARAFVRSDPFEVWGDGEQLRNWTYVDDIVEGTLLCGELVDDASAVNIGTTEETTVCQAASWIMETFRYQAPLAPRPDMPIGPARRIADISTARQHLGFEPRWSLRDGLVKTIEWYRSEKKPDDVLDTLERGLLSRGVE